MTATMLELDTIRAGYNDAIAIENISLTVGRSEVVCLLGANGAGKTTTMRVVTGLIPLLSGTIRYNGEDISQMPAHDRVTAGICLSPEGRQVFPDLTVTENLSLGSFNRRARPNRKQTLDQVLTLFPKLAERSGQAAGRRGPARAHHVRRSSTMWWPAPGTTASSVPRISPRRGIACSFSRAAR